MFYDAFSFPLSPSSLVLDYVCFSSVGNVLFQPSLFSSSIVVGDLTFLSVPFRIFFLSCCLRLRRLNVLFHRFSTSSSSSSFFSSSLSSFSSLEILSENDEETSNEQLGQGNQKLFKRHKGLETNK